MKPDSRAPAHRWAVLKLFPETWFLQTKQNIKLEVLGQRGGGDQQALSDAGFVTPGRQNKRDNTSTANVKAM